MTAVWGVAAVLLLTVTVLLEIVRRCDFIVDEEDQKKISEEKRAFYSVLLFHEALSVSVLSVFIITLFKGVYLYIAIACGAALFSAAISTFPTLIKPRLSERLFGFARKTTSFFSGFLLTRPVTRVGEAVYKRLSRTKEEPSMTQDEIMSVVDTLEEEGDIEKAESEIIKGAIKFSDVTASDIMIPRVDVCGFDINSPISELVSDVELLEYSRIPIYNKSIDDIVGILPTKLLIKELSEIDRDKWQDYDIRGLLRAPYYIHMTREVSSLLKEFREEKRQMAIVVDEYGGTMGIVTAEDMIEEIVGDIFDESDDIEREYIKRQNGYEVDGLMSLDDFRRLFDHAEEYESDYNTVGGWTAERLGRIPEQGDSFEFENLVVTVLETDANRVKKVMAGINVETNGQE